MSKYVKNQHFLILNAINSLFHYAHRVGHVFFMRFPPLDAQNDPLGTPLGPIKNKVFGIIMLKTL